MTVVPYKGEALSKKQQVAKMFNSISGRYDFLNHFLSLGIDIQWRKKAIKYLDKFRPQFILDVATGTGDFAIEALALKPVRVTGVDISEGMLEMGRRKIKNLGLQDKIDLMIGDSESLPFGDNSFDAVIVAFGVRNFENLDKGLNEIYRVLRQNGSLVLLEFSKPLKFPIKLLSGIYFKYILPVVGVLLSKDRAAYTYLPESVEAFPDGENFLMHLRDLKFRTCHCQSLTFGISSLYTAIK